MTEVEYKSDASGVFTTAAEEAVDTAPGGVLVATTTSRPTKNSDNPIELTRTYGSSVSGNDEVRITTSSDGSEADDEENDDVDMEEGRLQSGEGDNVLDISALTSSTNPHDNDEPHSSVSSSSSDFQLLDYDYNLLASSSLLNSMSENPAGDDSKLIDAGHGDDYDFNFALDISSLGAQSITDLYRRQQQSDVTANGRIWLGNIVGLASPSMEEIEFQQVTTSPNVTQSKMMTPHSKANTNSQDENSQKMGPQNESRGDFVEPAKIFGVSPKRVVAACACLVVLALIVIIVAVVMINTSSDENDSSPTGFDAFRDGRTLSPIFQPTISPTPAPTTIPPTTTPVVICLPDNETATFLIDGEDHDCALFIERHSDKREELCKQRADVFSTCRWTCGNCATQAANSTASPTASNSTELPTKSPASEPPTTSSTTQSPTIYSTEVPTASPSTKLPTASPSTSTPSETLRPTTEGGCPADRAGDIPGRSVTCGWLRLTNELYRQNQCRQISAVRIHCPTTCQNC